MEYIVNLLHVWAILGGLLIYGNVIAYRDIKNNPTGVYDYVSDNVSKRKRLFNKARDYVCYAINLFGAVYLGMNGHIIAPVVMTLATISYRGLLNTIKETKELL